MAVFICIGLYNEADSFQKGRTGFRDGVGEQGIPLPPLVLMQSPSERVRPCRMVPAGSRGSSFPLLNHGGISGGQRGEEVRKGSKRKRKGERELRSKEEVPRQRGR